MTIDPYRMLFDRLELARPASDEAREAVFDECRAEVAAAEADPKQRQRELEQLEKAIRRHRVQALYDGNPAPTSPAHADEIYESVRFECLRSGVLRPGTIGWRDGGDPWVALQIHNGPSISAGRSSVQGAYDAAANALARQGYAAMLGDATFPFSDSGCHAKRYARRAMWKKRAQIALAATGLLLAGIVIGLLLG